MARFDSRRRTKRSAFTLMEVLLVLVILVVLGSLAVGVYTGIRKNALRQAAQVQVDSLSGNCDLYYNDMNSWPNDLVALRINPGSDNWHGPYLGSDLGPDPWGSQYNYDAKGGQWHNGEKPDIWSNGPPNENTLIHNH
jgi:general secretion pathway protein G